MNSLKQRSAASDVRKGTVSQNAGRGVSSCAYAAVNDCVSSPPAAVMPTVMRQCHGLLVLLFILLSGCSDRGQSQLSASSPDVAFIILDAQRAQAMEVYGFGGNTSPFLRRIAEDLVLFDSCRTNAFWTRPSIPSILTGLFVSNHAQTQHVPEKKYHDILSPAFDTLPEYFKRSGYTTALFSSMGWYNGAMGFEQGFDLIANPSVLDEWLKKNNLLADSQPYGVQCRLRDRAAFQVCLEHRKQLADLDTHVFNYIHLVGAHGPLTLPSDLRDRLTEFVSVEEYIQNLGKYGEDLGRGPQQSDLFETDLDYRDFNFRLYLELIKFTDYLLGEFVHEYLTISPNTLFVITADHGEMFHEKYYEYLHGESVTPYDLLLRIPLIFYWPNRLSGRRVETPAMLVDLVPTLVDLLSLDDSRMRVDGESLAGLIRGEAAPHALNTRPCFAEGDYEQLSYAVLRGDFKLIAVHPSNQSSTWQMNRLCRHSAAQALFAVGSDEAKNFMYRFSEETAQLRNVANRILLGRQGFHLVLAGGGHKAIYQGEVESAEEIDRCSIRYHHPERPYDAGLVLDTEANLLFGADVITCGPASEFRIAENAPQLRLAAQQEIALRMRPSREMTRGRVWPMAVMWGFRFANPQSKASVRTTFRCEENKNMMPTVDIIEAHNIKDGHFYRHSITDSARHFTIRFENLSNSSEVMLTGCFAVPTQASGFAYECSNGKLSYSFALAEGMADVNWRYKISPMSVTFTGNDLATPLYVWRNDSFQPLEWPVTMDPEQLKQAIGYSPSPDSAPVEALLAAYGQGQHGVYVYRYGWPCNSECPPDEVDYRMDEETIRDLRGLGYIR